MPQSARSLRTFSVIWFGQVVSLLGTGMTRFALAIWVWQHTGAVTSMALIGISSALPALVAKFVAGPLVDRWNRRHILIASDLLAGVCTVTVLALYTSGQLTVWYLYLLSAITGCVGTFQSLAYSVAVTMMLPKAQYARASAMISLAEYASLVGAPLLGGVLLSTLGFSSIFLIDVVTFLFAVSTLLSVRIPQPLSTMAEPAQSLWRESLSGFQYILQRPSLRGLLLITMAFSLTEALGFPLITPMILARTGNEVLVGSVQASQGIGGLAGGLLVSIWGGSKRRIHGLLIGIALTGLLGDALMGVGQSLIGWIVAGFFVEVFIPIVVGSYQAIWQAKTIPSLQGRVFAARNLVASIGEVVAMLVSGMLIDRVLGSAMLPGGKLADVFGRLVGTGQGAGMGLLLVLCGVLTALVGLSGYAFRHIREVETLLPDQDPELGTAMA